MAGAKVRMWPSASFFSTIFLLWPFIFAFRNALVERTSPIMIIRGNTYRPGLLANSPTVPLFNPHSCLAKWALTHLCSTKRVSRLLNQHPCLSKEATQAKQPQKVPAFPWVPLLIDTILSIQTGMQWKVRREQHRAQAWQGRLDKTY